MQLSNYLCFLCKISDGKRVFNKDEHLDTFHLFNLKVLQTKTFSNNVSTDPIRKPITWKFFSNRHYYSDLHSKHMPAKLKFIKVPVETR